MAAGSNRAIELNNGRMVYMKAGESKSGLLIRILEAASKELGHVPSLEEAETLPDMPKDLKLYKRYCGSYDRAVSVLARREQNRQSWQKAPEGYGESLGSSKPKKYYQTSEIYGLSKPKAVDVSRDEKSRLLQLVVDEYHDNGDKMPSPRKLKKNKLFNLGDLWSVFGDYQKLCAEVEKAVGKLAVEPVVKPAVAKKSKVEPPKVAPEIKREVRKMAEELKQVAKETVEPKVAKPETVEPKAAKHERSESAKAFAGVIIEFARANLRWPTDREIHDKQRAHEPGWMSSAEAHRIFGRRETWPEQFFPEGLPEGFTVKNTSAVAKKPVVKAEVPKVEAPKVEAPKAEAPKAEETRAPQVVPEAEVVDETVKAATQTPQDVFMEIVKQCSELTMKASGAVELELFLRVPNESPFQFKLTLKA